MESNFSNTEAILALAASDPNGFSPFVEHFQYPLFGFLGRMGFSQTDAEELAQEVFIKVWRYRASYLSDKSTVSTWLFTIARNTALDRLKKNRLRNPADDQSLPDVEEIAEDPLQQPEARLLQQQTQRQLTNAISQLSPDDRCVIALFYIDDLSSTQAACVMQCSTSAFKTRLSRARSKLKTILLAMDAIQ